MDTLLPEGAVAGRGAWGAEDEAAYASFYLGHFAGVTRTAYLVVRDWAAAEDITQDAFVQLYVHWRKISRYEQPDAWVRCVAIRMARRFAKRERMRDVLSRRAQEPPPDASPADIDLQRVIAKLTPAQRAVVALFYFDDLSVAQVANALQCSESSVKVSLHRARRAMAQLLDDRSATDE